MPALFCRPPFPPTATVADASPLTRPSHHLPNHQQIQRLASDFLHDYIFLTVGRVGSSTDLIAQHIEYMKPDQKKETVLDCVNTVEVRPRLCIARSRPAPAWRGCLTAKRLRPAAALPQPALAGQACSRERAV